MFKGLKRTLRGLWQSLRGIEDDDEVRAGEGFEGPAQPGDYVPPEERVVQLLERNGGARRQRDVQEETGWSPAKTSRVLSEMEDDGIVERYELGREKVACLPGRVPPHLLDATDPDRNSNETS